MIKNLMKFVSFPALLGITVLGLGFALADPAPENKSGDKKLKVLIVTGGCCHDYEFQSAAMIEGIGKHTGAEFTLVNEGGKGTEAQIPLYDDPAWAKPYDVVIHNECFAATMDEDYIRKITNAHKAGAPAVVVHCAMHTYRSAKIDDWREFLGVTSRHHEHQSNYPVKVEVADHPVMTNFPKDWVTPKDELYIIEKTWPKTTVLATSKSEKNQSVHPVMWVNDFHGTRVVGTTYGHTNETFGDPVFIEFLSRGVVWAAGREWKD
jgi:type 1 glutamine amidotransferase